MAIMRIRLAFKFIFYFFGTCLHELAHYVAAHLLGKAEGFSVIPRIEGTQIVLGSVRSRVRYKFLSSFIASAPLVWWAILLLILLYLHIIQLNNGIPIISSGVVMKKLRSISVSDAFLGWVFIQLLWAGRLSVEDLKNVIKGMLSVSGMVFLSVVTILVYLLWHIISN
jgi:hypothetical protein